MSGVVRRRAMAGVVGFVLLWPLFHMALVARAHVDPWEFFGWAMYSKPAVRLQIRVEVDRAGEIQPLRAMGELRSRVKHFARRRSTLGSLASPDELIAAIFDSDETIDAIEIVLREIELERESGTLVARDHPHRFERPAARD